MKKLTSAVLLLIISLILLCNKIIYAKTSPPTAVNDECLGAINITPTLNAVYSSYNNYYATLSSVPIPGCATSINGDVWFSVIVPSSGHIIIDSKSNGMLDGGMAIYTGSCGNLNLIACNDNKGNSSINDFLMPQIEKMGLTAFSTIYIRFWGKNPYYYGNFLLAVITVPLQLSFTNPGFENDTAGWFTTTGKLYTGTVNTPIYVPLLFNFRPDSNITFVTSGTDLYGGFPKVYNGAKSLRLGDSLFYQEYRGATVEQTFTVGTNTNFIYNYAVVLQNANHLPTENPFFQFDLFDQNGNSVSSVINTLKIPNLSFTQSSVDTNMYYKPWTTVSVNLSAYVGQIITVRFTVSDCSPSGHLGYAYIDCSCETFQITSTQDSICFGQNDTLKAPPGALSYLWTPGNDTTQTITVNPTITTTYSCNFTNQGNTPSTTTLTKTIFVKPLPANASVIIGPTTLCIGQSNIIYKVPLIANATSYIWNLPTGVNGTSSNDSIILSFSSSAVTGYVTVKGNNSCGQGDSSSLIVNLEHPVATPGLISGLTTVCQGQNNVIYKVPLINNATSYIWKLPLDVYGTSTTDSIFVSYSNTAVSGKIVVKGSNSCGSGDSSFINISVNPFPDPAGTIISASNDTVYPNENNAMYIVPLISNASAYNWYYSGSGVTFYPSNITSTDSVWLNFASNATSGNLTVRGINSCGTGLFSANYPIFITVGIYENFDEIQYKIYPNPAKNNLIIELKGNKIIQNTSLSIYNIQGQLLKQLAIKESKTEIDIHSFARGIYIVKVNNEKENLVSRFVKE